METIDTASAEERDAVTTINTAVDGNDSSSAIISDLEKNKEQLEQGERKLVEQYIAGVRPQIEGALVQDLGATVGGLYDGSNVTMGKSVLYVSADVETTIDNAKETRDHENYHEEHDHTAAMIAGSSAAGDTVVTIGDHSFTDEALIEGITVAQTGDEFVSKEYKQFKSEVHVAIAAAGIDLEDVEEAIAKKDLRLIDDTDRRQRAKAAASRGMEHTMVS